MFEKVNPSHPDKMCDRIGGAVVDLAYAEAENPRIAVEILMGHGHCRVMTETSVHIEPEKVFAAVTRIAGDMKAEYIEAKQDEHLANNQSEGIRCGDNGIFKGMPVTKEQKELTKIAQAIYEKYPTDGKYILADGKLIICQSNASTEELKALYPDAVINPLGEWTGGPDVDTGAVNRKLGSDMGDSVTGGGLCLSGDSEYLGEDNRWHRMDEYGGGKVAQWNDGNLEFVEPTRYISNEADSFIHIYNSSKLDMMLTPYHNVLIKTSKGNLVKRPASVIAEKLSRQTGNSGSILHSFIYNHQSGVSRYADENDYRLQAAFCADGTILGEPYKRWNGRIRVKKQYKKERLRDLLSGKDYKETQDGEYSIFWYRFAMQSKSLYECFNDEDWTILKEEIFKWDGSEKQSVFRTTKKDDADFIQLVIASFGDCATITVNDRRGESQHAAGKEYTRKSTLYIVHKMESNKTGLRTSKGTPINVNYEPEKMPSYCFEVPSHNLIIRHNNKIFITGNCGKDLSKADVSVNIYAWLKAQKTKKPVELFCAIGDKEVDGKPYEEIVEIASDYINSLGGFEKFAEWGLIR